MVVTAVLAATAVAARHQRGVVAIGWTEAPWQIPLDNWGRGKAWVSRTADGAEMRLFARTKTGFCNCFSGIANDDEIDRIGDVDLHGEDFAPVAPGTTASVGELSGRKRLFRTSGGWTGGRYVLSIVAASDCKAVVATIVSSEPVPPEAEAAAIALLSAEPFRRWAEDQ